MTFPTDRSLVIAHRGASGYRPEHSRSAVELAIEQGADAIEPDLVATRDGVLVVRHDNELSTTTDVAAHPRFLARRRTAVVAGQRLTGWFTEDFTWSELSTLMVRERMPKVRLGNVAYDGREPILSLDDLLRIIRPHRVLLVAELKHAAHFESIGLPLDRLLLEQLGDFPRERTIVESFELTVLRQLTLVGFDSRMVYLIDAEGAPADRPGDTFADALTPAGLAQLAREVHAISVDSSLVFTTDVRGRPAATGLVDRAHSANLSIFTWTLRAENRFLLPAHRLPGSPIAFGDWRREFARIFATGVDGVFADQPDLALAARDGGNDGGTDGGSVGGRA